MVPQQAPATGDTASSQHRCPSRCASPLQRGEARRSCLEESSDLTSVGGRIRTPGRREHRPREARLRRLRSREIGIRRCRCRIHEIDPAVRRRPGSQRPHQREVGERVTAGEGHDDQGCPFDDAGSYHDVGSRRDSTGHRSRVRAAAELRDGRRCPHPARRSSRVRGTHQESLTFSRGTTRMKPSGSGRGVFSRLQNIR